MVCKMPGQRQTVKCVILKKDGTDRGMKIQVVPYEGG